MIEPRTRIPLKLRQRQAFTLMELILSLGLAAIIAGMIGSLVQIFLINQEKGQDSVRQAQLARAILNMISEDIRTTVRHQTFDTSGLQQILSGDSGGSGGGGGASPADSSGTGPGAPSSAPATASAAPSGASDSDPAATTQAELPPGIYGTNTSIEIDVSRLPRPDEYYPQLNNSQTGALGDMPSDIKTVGYYIQTPGVDGVQDPLSTLTQEQVSGASTATPLSNGGLVRRSVDRAVTLYAYQNGSSSQLQKTGQLVAPEVIAIDFSYYDGTTWQTQWDSSTQGLPHVVKIVIAMQRDSRSKTNPITQGMTIASITSSMRQEYGIEIYSTNTIIPGAQLLAAPQGTNPSGSSDSGMGSVGL